MVSSPTCSTWWWEWWNEDPRDKQFPQEELGNIIELWDE